MGCCSSRLRDPKPTGRPGVWETGRLLLSVRPAPAEEKEALELKGMLFEINFELFSDTSILSGFRGSWSWTVYRTPLELMSLHRHVENTPELPDSLGLWRLIKLALMEKEPELFLTQARLEEIEGEQEVAAPAVAKYLGDLLGANGEDSGTDRPLCRSSLPVLIFCEVSTFSFDESTPKPLMEGFARKRRGGRKFMRQTALGAAANVVAFFKRYSKRWFVLREDHLLYSKAPAGLGGTGTTDGKKYTSSSSVFAEAEGGTDDSPVLSPRRQSISDDSPTRSGIPSNFRPLDIILFDSKFSVEEIRPAASMAKRVAWWCAGYTNALRVRNGYRTVVLKFPSRSKMLAWKRAIEQAKEKSGCLEKHRFDAATGPKESTADLLVDGAEYFASVLEALKSAKEDVFISGWWLTPGLPLKRPCQHQGNRLIDVLAERAAAGVKVFVILYHEFSSLANDALHACKTLEDAHPRNIRAICHPAKVGANAILYWSHHGKLVVTDGSTAFAGGVDLCLGRFDLSSHPITDYSGELLFPGRDYQNPCRRDFAPKDARSGVDLPSLLNRETEPRLPWHDVAVRVSGAAAGDLARHFVQLWNHVKTDRWKGQAKVGYLTGKRGMGLNGSSFIRSRAGEKKGVTSVAEGVPSETSPSVRHRLKRRMKTWLNKASRSKEENTTTERIRLSGGNTTDEEEMITVYEEPADDIPSSPDNQNTLPVPVSREEIKRELLRSGGQEETIIPLARSGTAQGNGESPLYSVQVLRSISWWSLGLPRESSFLAAYINGIQRSRDYVYIENQFFISKAGETDSDVYHSGVENTVAKCLVDRIKLAEQSSGDLFRVYIVLPVMPGFQISSAAQFFAPESYVARCQIYLINSSLRSMRDELGDEVFDRRVTVHALRKYEEFPDGKIRAEQIYVHSKVFISDDQIAIIGSANLNDRSLLGGRDSEVGVFIEGQEFARSARLRLWSEHLGSEDEVREEVSSLGFHHPLLTVIDSPSSEHCFQFWKNRSLVNTSVFQKVFAVWPDNSIRDRGQLASAENRVVLPSTEIEEELSKIKGRIVDYALDFLVDEADIHPPVPFVHTVVARSMLQ